jgi:predicted phosphodiesterase
MSRRRRAGLALIAAVCGLAGAWAAPRVVGPGTYGTTVAEVQLRLAVSTPGQRGMNLYVPLADWGLRAEVFDAPVRVGLEPRRINRVGVVGIVSSGGRGAVSELRSQLDGSLRSAVLRFTLISLAGALAGGLLALLIWHGLGIRGRRRLLLAPAGAAGLTVLLIGVLGGWTAVSYDATKLERPSFYASGEELERILVQADALRRSSRKYADRVDNAVRAITGLIGDRGGGAASPLAPQTGGGETTRLVLASDIHNNLLTLPTLRRYAHDQLTVLAGDFTINGSRAETPLLERMAAVGDPVVAVSGNHDSPGIMRALERRDVIVLDHDDGVRTIAGLDLAGFEDPLMLGGREFPKGIRAGISFGDIPDGHERFLAAIEQRWQWWQALPSRPDVLVVHQESLGQALANLIWATEPDGPPLTILVGHTHRQRMDRYGPVTVVNSGSIGAGGLFGIGSQDVGLAILAMRADGGLEATDLVAQDPSTSAARARRVITDSPDCDGELVVCHEEPELPEIPSAPTPTPTATP